MDTLNKYYCTISINSGGGVTCDLRTENLVSVTMPVTCDPNFFSGGSAGWAGAGDEKKRHIA